MAPAAVVGVFAGGAGRRMGGRDKAALVAPEGGTVLEHLAGVARTCDCEVVAVGGGERAGLVTLADIPRAIGPLGGLGPLLRHAGGRPAVALACDMPFVDAELLSLLLRARPDAAVVAPRDPASGKYQPLFARYRASAVLPALAQCLDAGERSFQRLLGRCGVVELELSAPQWSKLRDWDHPEDITRS